MKKIERNGKKKHCLQQAVWRKRGCCLVGHLAGFWEFCSRPSLTDTPACPKLLKRCTQCADCACGQDAVKLKV